MWSATQTLFKLLLCIALSVAIVQSAPLAIHQVEELSASPPLAHTRRQSSLEVVTGIQQFGIQPRLEIRQLEKNVDQFNIYLLGLVKFQATNQSEKLSYYDIAG